MITGIRPYARYQTCYVKEDRTARFVWDPTISTWYMDQKMKQYEGMTLRFQVESQVPQVDMLVPNGTLCIAGCRGQFSAVVATQQQAELMQQLQAKRDDLVVSHGPCARVCIVVAAVLLGAGLIWVVLGFILAAANVDVVRYWFWFLG